MVFHSYVSLLVRHSLTMVIVAGQWGNGGGPRRPSAPEEGLEDPENNVENGGIQQGLSGFKL